MLYNILNFITYNRILNIKMININRRKFLLGTTSFSVLPQIGFSQLIKEKLPILPILDVTEGINEKIKLDLISSNHDFGTGTASSTLGINSSHLGPVLRVKQGQTLPFEITNYLDEVSTLHWHGLHIPGDMDGGPHQEIEPNYKWSPTLRLTQQASMNWFHSHAHGRTAKQVYNGLVGVMLLEDDASLSADLPMKYGIDDFTLILQDKTFNNSGVLKYELNETTIEDGFFGENLVINGIISPVIQQVPEGLVRLRILNACNANFLTLSMQKGPLNIIASDGGFLNSTVKTEEIVMSPGERYEILVDMKKFDINQLLVKYELPELKGLKGLKRELLYDGERKIVVLELFRSNETGFMGSLPNNLGNVSPPNRNEALNTRSFMLQQNTGVNLKNLANLSDGICGDLNAMMINGKSMDMTHINENVKKGDTEIWRISVDDWRHPFHIHGCSFKILQQEEKEPESYASGWKDIVHVDGEKWSEVIVKFNHEASKEHPYMYHCHILEHEDCGMMGQFTVS